VPEDADYVDAARSNKKSWIEMDSSATQWEDEQTQTLGQVDPVGEAKLLWGTSENEIDPALIQEEKDIFKFKDIDGNIKTLKYVRQFKYLGVIFDQHLRVTPHIKWRRQKAFTFARTAYFHLVRIDEEKIEANLTEEEKKKSTSCAKILASAVLKSILSYGMGPFTPTTTEEKVFMRAHHEVARRLLGKVAHYQGGEEGNERFAFEESPEDVCKQLGIADGHYIMARERLLLFGALQRDQRALKMHPGNWKTEYTARRSGKAISWFEKIRQDMKFHWKEQTQSMEDPTKQVHILAITHSKTAWKQSVGEANGKAKLTKVGNESEVLDQQVQRETEEEEDTELEQLVEESEQTEE
jgi:hypothetical protein